MAMKPLDVNHINMEFYNGLSNDNHNLAIVYNQKKKRQRGKYVPVASTS